MIIPKLELPNYKIHSKEAAAEWIVEQFNHLVEEQKSGLALSLAAIEHSDPSYVHGFLACYGIFRNAILKKSVDELEGMFKENA